MINIKFRKATIEDKDIIFSWLAETHVQEFWDNTQAHKDDILNFMDGRIIESHYCDGRYVYWIAEINCIPYAMIMSLQETHFDDIGELKLAHLSRTGNNYSLDFMIGNIDYVGKGLGAKTLSEFVSFIKTEIDHKVECFLIDPEIDNTRAAHVYEKAGFRRCGEFLMEGNSSGSGKTHHLLVKKILPEVNVLKAQLADYPMIQNMARFYVYDLSRSCGYTSVDWCLPENGLYESFDLKKYFVEPEREAYIIKVYDETAGFVMLNKAFVGESTFTEKSWCIREFFILAKFQGLGIGGIAASKIFKLHPEKWQVTVIPENKPAYYFWKSIINKIDNLDFCETTVNVDYDKFQPKRIAFEFTVSS